MNRALIAALAAGFAVAAPAGAAVLTVNGTTSGEPTFNRPAGGIAPVALSADGTAVPYKVTAFTVDVAGDYNFLMTAVDPAGWDTYLHLYVDGFDAEDALANVLVGNDDFPSAGVSGFTESLLAGLTYFAVASGFADDESGSYALRIEGPGAIALAGSTSVPEPAALSILGLGLAGLAFRGVIRPRHRC